MTVPTSDSLRITVVVGVFPALSETFVLDQVISLIERGHDVRIIADRPRDERGVHDEVAQHYLLSRTRYLRVPSVRREHLTLLARAAQRAGPKFVKTLVSFARAHRRLGEPGSFGELAAMVTAFAEAPRPDVILCHFGPSGASVVRALDALDWDLPVATIFHGYDLSLLVQQFGPHLYDHLFRKGDLFLPACEAFANRLRALGCPPERIMVQRMCVTLAKLDAAVLALGGVPPRAEGLTFVCVGRLVSKKGFDHAIRAFARAFGHGAPAYVRLRLVGDGPLRGDLESLAAQAGVADRVEFLGALPREAVLSAMLAADALVQPSVTAANGDEESSPLVISEAMALRKPVFGTRHSGIPELVLDGVTGRLVDEGDESGLAAMMAWMMANRPAAAQMGEAGRLRLEAGLIAEHWDTVLEDRLLWTAQRGAFSKC